jgi:hypothetical protein
LNNTIDHDDLNCIFLISILNNRYTNLYSAVTFLENVQHDSLTISEEEFTKGMQEAKVQMQEAKEMARTSVLEEEEEQQEQEQQPQQKKQMLEDVFGGGGQVETKSFGSTTGSTTVDPTKRTRQVIQTAKRWTAAAPPLQPPPSSLQGNQPQQSVVAWKAHRYRFLARRVSELKVTEVGALLQEYKHLASTTDQLLKERTDLIARIEELEGARKEE